MINELNKLGEKYLLGFDFNGIKPIRQFYDPTIDGITFCPPRSEAFNLNPAIAGKLKTHLTEEHTIIPSELLNKKEVVAIHRTTLGYRWGKDCIENESKFVYDMMITINNALIELQDKLGDLSKYKLVLERPGLSKEYFREMNHTAGYDFRICVMNKDKEE